MGRFPLGWASRRHLAIVVAWCIGAGTAFADEKGLEKARTAVDQLDYTAAQAALTETIDSGSNGPDQMVELYRLTGIVAASLGDAKLATEAFKTLLALSPKATLPAGTSPKISRPFGTARDYFKKHEPLRVKAETSNDPPQATLVIESDALGLVVGARVLAIVDGKPEKKLEGTGTGKIEIAVPQGHRIDLRIAAIDKHGNRLVELGSTEVPLVIIGTAPAPEPPKVIAKPIVKVPPRAQRTPRPWYLKWWAWTGAAVATTGAATYFGFAARSNARELQGLFDNSINHRIGESTALESRTRRDVIVTNISLGTAGVFALGAAILYLTDRHAERRRQTGIAITPTTGGGVFVVGGGF